MGPRRTTRTLVRALSVAVVMTSAAGSAAVAAEPEVCQTLVAGELCGPGGGRMTPGGGDKVSHVGWPAITGVLWQVADSGDHQRTGGPDDDELLGHHGSDTIAGGPGRDVIWGDWDPKGNSTQQRDWLSGDDGDDWLYSSHGTNTIRAGAGDDVVWAYYGHGTIDCGPGRDTLRVRLVNGYLARNCERVKNFCAFGSKPGDAGGCYRPGEKPASRRR